MGSCAEEWPGGLTGADAEVGALVWVRRRNGSWWPGRILGMDELPENFTMSPRSTDTPIKLLGRPDGRIDWYNLEKSKRVKSFRCGEYDECIEKAKALACQQNRTQTEGRYVCREGYVRREDAIIHALEIERSHLPLQGQLNTYESCASIKDQIFFQKHIKDQISEPMSQTTDCSKEGISSIRNCSCFKMETISFVTPISEVSHKSNKSLLPPLYEGTVECEAEDSDVVRLDARFEGAVPEPTGHENDTQLYDVKLTVHGNFEGHGLPLAFLTSKSIGKPVMGYPITVEVLEDGYSTDIIAAQQLAALTAYSRVEIK